MTSLASSFRARLAATLAVSALGAGLVAAACTTEQVVASRLCTPNAYVYCRCSDRSEGTKQCNTTGNSFADCSCGNTGDLTPGGNASFQQVDAGTPDANAIAAKCAGKLAVLAGSSESLDVYGASYGGAGKWSVSVSTGAALRSTPRGALVGTSLIAVWQTRQTLMAWTKFSAGQTALSPPSSMGKYTDTAPDFVGGATGGTLVYKMLDSNDLSYESYAGASGWPADDGVNALVIPNSATVQKTPPMVAPLGAGYAIAFGSGSDLSAVNVQTSNGTNWDASAPIAAAQSYNGQTPVIAALTGPEDLMVAYQGPDLKLHSVTRMKATGAWNAPILVDTAASPNGAPAIYTLSEGRAILVWRGSDNTASYSIYTPGSPGTWSNPNGIVASSPRLRTPPAVSGGNCASDVTVTYVDNTDGNVWITFYKDSAWVGPYQVPGMTNMTYAGAGEVP